MPAGTIHFYDFFMPRPSVSNRYFISEAPLPSGHAFGVRSFDKPTMIDSDRNLATHDPVPHLRLLLRYLMLPVAGMGVAAIVSVWASAETAVTALRHDPVQCCDETHEHIAHVVCDDHATPPRHPAKGANIPLAFHTAQGMRP